MKSTSYISAALIALSAASPLSSLEIDSFLNLSGGYRNDIISAHNTITSPTGTVVVDRLRFDNIDLGAVGFTFRGTMPQVDCCCDYPFLANFYVEGNAYWGWSGRDDFERVTSVQNNEGVVSSSFVSQGKQRARTQDWQIGLGYLLYNCDCWAVAVAGGYAYDWQRVRIGNGSTSFNGGAFDQDPLYDGLVFKQRWQSPWVGANLFWESCDTLVDIGYEYHFAHYHAAFSIPRSPEAQASDFSDTRKSNSAYGNVAYINARQRICECWDAGLGITYKQFRTRHCHIAPKSGSFVNEGFAAGTKGSASAKWITWSLLADVGYWF